MMVEGKKIFITGGGGFIGSHLCQRLIEANEIVVYDNGHRNAIQYTSLLDHPHLTFVQGDVLDGHTVAQAMSGCNVVLHLAAIAGIDTVVKRPIVTMEVNLLGTHHVLEATSRLPDAERLIIFSTSEVYGPHVYKATEDGLTTQGAVGKMRWVYATSKLAAEHLASCYAQEYNTPLTIIRPFNVYGPRQVGESAITKFTIAALKNDTLFIAGDGSQIRSWCYIDDFIDGVMAALESPVAIGEVFNLGDPKQTCIILNLAETILRLTNSTSEIRFFEQDAPDVEVRVPSTAKAQRLLGYAPRYGLEDGLKKTIRWYKKMGDR